MKMAKNGVFSRLRRMDKSEGVDEYAANPSHQVHVLAVDDSLVDRKVIERLLKITSCKGANRLFLGFLMQESGFHSLLTIWVFFSDGSG